MNTLICDSEVIEQFSSFVEININLTSGVACVEWKTVKTYTILQSTNMSFANHRLFFTIDTYLYVLDLKFEK